MYPGPCSLSLAEQCLFPFRDHWETKQPRIEAKLSSLLGRPWVKSINTAPLYALVKERYAKEGPGVMNAEYGVTRKIFVILVA